MFFVVVNEIRGTVFHVFIQLVPVPLFSLAKQR